MPSNMGCRTALVMVTLLTGFAPARAQLAQSPIDLRAELVTVMPSLPALTPNYQSAATVSVVNTGEEIRVNVPAGSSLTVSGTTYAFEQFHFHFASEHLIQGQHTPIEMHMVHSPVNGRRTVLGVFIEEGTPNNPAIQTLFGNLPAGGQTNTLNNFALDGLLPSSQNSYRYDGSLTTSPFTENVNWIVFQEPILLSAAQIQAYEDLFANQNNRPVQPLNGRPILTDFTPVPEPASFALVAAAAAVPTVRRLRRHLLLDDRREKMP